ncbi:MAG TPA: 4Fe-4S dicluster domain-containing protein [Candidatus Bathyarchaeia archaeon]|nr:4Fe-4S dicluster domain-containing protein [Candidatus Bathyarchaeia archaeon]
MQFIDSTNFERFLKKLSAGGELFVPVRNPETAKLHLERIELFPLPDNLCLDGYRTVDSLKAFAQLLRYPVADYPSTDGDDMADDKSFPRFVIAGARGCDLNAMGLIDKVQIEGEFTDPFYKIRRDRMFIIGADCSECGKTCFCNLHGARPWPERGYDITVSKIQGGYLVEAGTERGGKLMKDAGELFAEAREAQIKMREEIRAKVVRELEELNGAYPRAEEMPESMRAALSDEIWEDISARCVECGACTNICPTCYCFLLYDQKAGGSRFQRVFAWDTCQVTGYARMAGMLNPRPRLPDRVKHRYYHKYDYLPLSHGAIYCTGCGRCIDTCSALIDMRDALRRVREKFGAKKKA